ncbi:MAG TPA: hypothetical protein VEC37_15250 [Bacillota bacterium]|nr:hypothetical protein [Bacillota bacterium]
MKKTILVILLVFLSVFAVIIQPGRILAYSTQDTVEQQITIGEAGNTPYVTSVAISGVDAVAAGDDGVYFFERERREPGGDWVYKQKLIQSGLPPFDYPHSFGYRVAISGNVAMVAGYIGEYSGSTSFQVYIYEKDMSGVWQEKQTIFNSNYPIYLSPNIAVVLGYVLTLTGEGPYCTLYEKNSSGYWSATKRIDNCYSINISGNNMLAFQASDAWETYQPWSRVNIFERVGTYGTWVQKQDQWLQVHKRFSGNISGNSAIIGDPAADNTKGAAYVIERDSSAGVWRNKQKLIASDGMTGDRFGENVFIFDKQAFVLQNNYVLHKRTVYFFEQTGSEGQWVEKQKLTPKEAMEYTFGSKVVVSENFLFIVSSKALYIYQKDISSGTWEEKRVISINNNASVDISGRSVIIGAGDKVYFYNFIR